MGNVSLALLAVLMLVTVWDYGLIWDEEFHSVYGEHVSRVVPVWVSRRGRAPVQESASVLGASSTSSRSSLRHMSPLGVYEDRHLVNIAFAILALVGTWRLGETVLGTRGGVLAMLLTALTPMFYGHSFNNPKDIPFAALSVWTLCYTSTRVRGRFLRFRRAATRKACDLFGILLAIRPGGIFFFGYIASGGPCTLVAARRAAAAAALRPAAALALVCASAHGY